MTATKPENVNKTCSVCSEIKSIKEFVTNDSKKCKDCNNNQRRQKYMQNEEHRKKLIERASVFKHKKVIERQAIRQQEQEAIGIGNMECKYCNVVKASERFRYNRRKCRDCERDEPVEKFKRYVRTRIYNCLKHHKDKSHIEYLGCSTKEYLEWITTYNSEYTLDNYGSIWHIDHVIPISTFNINDLEDQLLAFNWRNTMPLSAKENLQKGNTILKEQIRTHNEKLKLYHAKKNIEMPEKYEELFARHLVAGNPLESLTTTL
jgi:hypothetical protein